MDFFSGIPTRQDCNEELIEFGQNHHSIETLLPIDHRLLSDEQNQIYDSFPISGSSYYSDSPEQPDYYEACLSYIQEALMEEEGSENSLFTMPDYGALVATEQSFYDALKESNHPSSSLSSNQHQSFFRPSIDNPNDEYLDSSSLFFYQDQIEPFLYPSDAPNYLLNSNSHPLVSINSLNNNLDDPLVDSPVSTLLAANPISGSFSRHVAENQGRKVHQRDDDVDCQDSRSNKQLAASNGEDEEYQVIKQYDDILLPENEKGEQSLQDSVQKENPNAKPAKGRKSRAKKRNSRKEELVDLRTLLTLCAQAVAGFDLKTANGLLKQIREHSSPFGGCIERVAHYFANGLEARMAGTGSHLYSHFVNAQVSPSGVLKAYQCYAKAVPIFRTSFYVSNMMILRSAKTATQIHIIDFGIYHGFQWPSLIQRLSEMKNGPPKLKITGIDFPLRGFRPAEKVEQTGRRLKAYCERFNVPFEYHAIAKPWELICEEDIKTEEGEFIIVNCQYRANTLLDEAAELNNSPRDAFLRLIKNLNPDIFIHGILNATYGVPFFLSRFREALFNFISMFDIYESTMQREDNDRKLIEQNLHGTEILNVVASEGNERVSRPETYKQWQDRMVRAGFIQQPIHKDLVQRSKDITKGNYHKDFVVDVDGHWMLQGWKGRILFAISYWKSAET